MDGIMSQAQERPAVHLLLSFRQLCLVTVSLPLCALVFCFVTAYIFQPDEIHETHCRVYNIIPSISAITGVSPQRYLWRICVALHIGPRLLIASIYHAYYKGLACTSHSQRLLSLCYWLNITEIASLCGVTYISNKENYPVHEKIFIVFMLCSLSHMLVTLKVSRLVHPTMSEKVPTAVHEKIFIVFMLCSLSHMLVTLKVSRLVHPTMSENVRISYLIKKVLFVTSILSTVGLLIFFAKHRLLCHDMAFSWFALCEYVIASANMAFHITVVLDFPTEELVIAKGLSLTNNFKLE